jgi:transcriptional adapter 2-alpha
MKADEQHLRKRIAELQEYRRAGITTGAEAEAYDVTRVARVSWRNCVSQE